MDKLEEKVAELVKLKNAIDEVGLKVITEGYTLADAIRDGAKVSEQAYGGYGNGANACGWTAAYLGWEAHKRKG